MGGKTSTSWKPGQSGNPRGRPKGKTPSMWFRQFLIMELTARGNGDVIQGLLPICRALIDRAIEGDVEAFTVRSKNEYGERPPLTVQ